MAREKVLIAVKTYPTLSNKYEDGSGIDRHLVWRVVKTVYSGGFRWLFWSLFRQRIGNSVPHYSRRSERKITSERFIDEHLDPLLKSADELVGKLLSLAQEDFQSIYDVDPLAGRISPALLS